MLSITGQSYEIIRTVSSNPRILVELEYCIYPYHCIAESGQLDQLNGKHLLGVHFVNFHERWDCTHRPRRGWTIATNVGPPARFQGCRDLSSGLPVHYAFLSKQSQSVALRHELISPASYPVGVASSIGYVVPISLNY